MLSIEKKWLVPSDTLCCFGDSITASEGGYVSLLAEHFSTKNISVINAGRNGDKTTTALTRFERDVLSRSPSALSILLGANDAAIGHGVWADEPMVSTEAYRVNLVWMIHLARLGGIEKISVCTPAAFYEGSAFEAYGDCLHDYCLAARAAADEMQARLVPFDAAFKSYHNNRSTTYPFLLTHDGIHLTPEGNQLLAETILATWGEN